MWGSGDGSRATHILPTWTWVPGIQVFDSSFLVIFNIQPVIKPRYFIYQAKEAIDFKNHQYFTYPSEKRMENHCQL